MPGSIFKARVNTHYYLGFGQPGEIAVQVRSNRFMTASKRGANVISFEEDSHMMGHQWLGTEAALDGKAYLCDIPKGSGRLILFADDPSFRNYWRGLDKLVLSAIVFGPSMP